MRVCDERKVRGPKGFRLTAVAVLTLVTLAAQVNANDIGNLPGSTLHPPLDAKEVTVPVVERNDLRFNRLSNPQSLSQVRVSEIVQDAQGFMWFGTWNGLNRYDGYKFKIFKHEAGNPASPSGVYVHSLFKDRSGTLWVGTDQFLDRFDPQTERFDHYRLKGAEPQSVGTTVNHISQDSRGMLWLSTRNGLFRFDPATGEFKNFHHDPDDPASLSDNDVKTTGEDRSGRFWVGTSQALDEFDRDTGKVKRHVLVGESGIGLWFHEDRFGVFWIICNSTGRIATLDRQTNRLTRYRFDWGKGPAKPNSAYAMLEDRDGTMWFGTSDGLLKWDREQQRFINYDHQPGDSDSLADSRVIALYQDHEGNIWTGLHQVEPNFFTNKPLPFDNLTRDASNPNSLGPGLAGTVYEDRDGVLWVGVNRMLKRLDRQTGKYSTFAPAAGSEVLSIIEDGADSLWLGNAGPGLLHYNRKTGHIAGYRHDSTDPTTLCSGIVQRLLIDRNGTLWAATWDGLCKFDGATERFTTYKPDPNARGLNYYAITEDRDGALWLGGNLGLHRFDPRSNQFTVYTHNVDDSRSLSDNRVNAVYVDRSGAVWAGTQNGLSRFDPKTGTFAVYDERHGMAGNAVSCIVEDSRSQLWMSTNKGVSSFNPLTRRFANYTTADGLPGPDLTGWGACYKSAAGEVFFAGFSGMTSFFPDRIADSSYAPPIVLTDFRLFGTGVAPGAGSPLKRAINYSKSITLTHEQNVFSIEFSALTYFNTATNRYRYKLQALEKEWHEVGSDERLATYTTLPAGSYTFHLQAATSRGPWSPAVTVAIEILPPIWKTTWFRTVCAALFSVLLWALYRLRLRHMAHQFNMRLEERVSERMRIAQELHDTLLQQFQAACLFLNAAERQLPERPENVQGKQTLKRVRTVVVESIAEGRAAIQGLRAGIDGDLSLAIQAECDRLTKGTGVAFYLDVIGMARPLRPEAAGEALQVAREALVNAVRHARARQLIARIQFLSHQLRVGIHDDGIGIPPAVAESGRPGHYGLQTMRERAERAGGRLEITPGEENGTSVIFVLPARHAYHEPSLADIGRGRWLQLYWKKLLRLADSEGTSE